MTLPSEVTIGGVVFEVVIGESDGCGEFDGAASRITISEELSPEKRCQTFWHECLHAGLYVTGQTERLTAKQEEGVVLALEHSLWPLLQSLVRS